MIAAITVLENDNDCKYYGNYELSKYEDLYFTSVPGDYLIDNEKFCKIPNLNPYSREAMNVFKVMKPTNCSNRQPLTSIQRQSDGNRLIINRQFMHDYLYWWHDDLSCCFHRITRSGSYDKADDEFSQSEECIEFESGYMLSVRDEFIIVHCSAFSTKPIISIIKTEIYKIAHATVITNEKVKRKIEKPKRTDKTNVLLIGIDSISRLNLMRAMPVTHDYLQQKQWIEMKGLNKVGDNTYPNYMAILAGVNETLAFKTCDPYKVGDIHKCRYLWDDYSDGNYATAYAEDTITMSSFNYLKKGFLRQPTDHYLRPFLLASESHLKTSLDYAKWNIVCLGNQHYADYIYNYATDFAENYQNSSFFGLFWTNSFSHEDLSYPSMYDIRMRNHLKRMEEKGILNNTIIVFFADHGMRFGPIRHHFTGWLEERLPFMYFWIPEKFKNRHPNLVENLKINSNRLITPFDVYITLKHILKLSGEYDKELTAISCRNCQSLFYEVPSNRSCADISIPDEYCTCAPFKKVDKSQSFVKDIARFIVNQINSKLTAFRQCAKLKLDKILSARELMYSGQVDRLISLSVLPSSGEFEATVRITWINQTYQLIGDISRINRYGDQSKCMNDSILRKYCYCV